MNRVQVLFDFHDDQWKTIITCKYAPSLPIEKNHCSLTYDSCGFFSLSLLFSHFSFVFHVESLILQCTDQMKEKESESKRLN